MKTKKRFVGILFVLCLAGGMITLSATNVAADSEAGAIMPGVSGINIQTE